MRVVPLNQASHIARAKSIEDLVMLEQNTFPICGTREVDRSINIGGIPELAEQAN
jgi:hypothetical protein